MDAARDSIGDTALSGVGALSAEPARANVLLALADGRALAAAHAVRYARRCYVHLAGRLGVAVTDALRTQGVLAGASGAQLRANGSHADRPPQPGGYTVTEDGAATPAGLGIHAQPGDVARACLDSTEQRDHIAGPVGNALMNRLLDLGWIVDAPATRALRITDSGRANLPDRLGVQLP